MDWLTENKIPLGKWIKSIVDLTNDHAAWFFDGISIALGFIIEGLTNLLIWFPPLILVALFVSASLWLHRSWKLSLMIGCSLLLIINLGYWESTLQTLSLVLFSSGFCMLIGVPLGIAAAHRPGLYRVLHPILDLMQTIPTFVYLIPTLILFGLGPVPGVISTMIFALPAPIRLTHLGITSVPRSMIDAVESFGATKSQILWKVELPSAKSTIMAGLTQCIMLSLSMVVIAALVGADGLGTPVVRALNTVNIAKGFEAGLAIVLVAIMLDRVCKERS
ncbi:MAG: choline ABC transporter permease subunit [SAR324 cluster bacterium]|uniref:Choline ABC transporter permease subunit n=1 Tax=SAR324 cluster bacterium TaxID=2024889 RepID=A0A2A4T901_9DELT|nr:MAG: choline ABC transporter permease subunit [SAR324 cluster bacterium]